VFWVHRQAAANLEALAEPPAMGNKATWSRAGADRQLERSEIRAHRLTFISVSFRSVASCGITYERAMFPEIMVQINFDALPCAEKKLFLSFVFGTRNVIPK
jgi:hypothetical protein